MSHSFIRPHLCDSSDWEKMTQDTRPTGVSMQFCSQYRLVTAEWPLTFSTRAAILPCISIPSIIGVDVEEGSPFTCTSIIEKRLCIHRLLPPFLNSTTIRLRTFRLRHFVYRHFVYRHFVYYCIPAYRTVIHLTSVSLNHYFHRFQLQLTLWFLFINPTSTDTMIIHHI